MTARRGTALSSSVFPSQLARPHRTRYLVVTAFDESHRLEATGLIASVQRHLSAASVLVFDLGMSASGRRELQSACDVQVRTFDWSWTPSLQALGAKKRLYGCGWKPTVIRLALETAGVGTAVIWADASVRFTSSAYEELERAAVGGVAARLTTGTVRQYTDPGMVTRWAELGGTNASASALSARMLAATIVLWTSTRSPASASARALRQWERCSLDIGCFAPPAARGQPCPMCHRYDQSALNLALHEAGLAAQVQRASAHIAAAARTERGGKWAGTIDTKCRRRESARRAGRPEASAASSQPPPRARWGSAPVRGDGGSGAFLRELARACRVNGTSMATAFGYQGETAPCLAFLRGRALPNGAGVRFHTFWAGTKCNGLHELLGHSFCCTQHEASRLTVWLWPRGTSAERTAALAACRARLRLERGGPCERRVDVRSLTASVIDPALCARDECSIDALATRYAAPPRSDPASFGRAAGGLSTALLSDHVRLFILWRYGGVWLDADTVLLRDFAPLLEAIHWRPFAYRWAQMPFINNAVLHSPARSAVLRSFFDCWRRGAIDGFTGRDLTQCCRSSQVRSQPYPYILAPPLPCNPLALSCVALHRHLHTVRRVYLYFPAPHSIRPGSRTRSSTRQERSGCGKAGRRLCTTRASPAGRRRTKLRRLATAWP